MNLYRKPFPPYTIRMTVSGAFVVGGQVAVAHNGKPFPRWQPRESLADRVSLGRFRVSTDGEVYVG